MLRLFKDEKAGARLLLSRDFEDRLNELGIHKYSRTYVKLSKDELNSYIEKTDDIEELSSIFYSRWYHIKNCGMADDIEKRDNRDWFIYILHRMEEVMNDEIACFGGDTAVNVKIVSVKNRMKQIIELFNDGTVKINGEEINTNSQVEIMSFIESLYDYFSIARIREETDKDNYYTVTINDSFTYSHSFESLRELSDELREILNNDKLFVFDGNKNRLDRIFFKYFRNDSYEGRSFETIELNRQFSSFQYVKNNFRDTYNLRITGDRVTELLDKIDPEILLGPKKDKNKKITDDNCTREYTLTYNFKNGEEKVIEGTYDLNGLPEMWPILIYNLNILMGNVGLGDIFNENYYNKIRHRKDDYMLCLVSVNGDERLFIGEDESLKAGDDVIVRLPDDDEAFGTIREINYYSADEAPVNLSALCYIDRIADEYDYEFLEEEE
ncbi:MAG: hypothetical protein ACI4WM_02015 [Erysipelotrichaceae bacterium]